MGREPNFPQAIGVGEHGIPGDISVIVPDETGPQGREVGGEDEQEEQTGEGGGMAMPAGLVYRTDTGLGGSARFRFWGLLGWGGHVEVKRWETFNILVRLYAPLKLRGISGYGPATCSQGNWLERGLARSGFREEDGDPFDPLHQGMDLPFLFIIGIGVGSGQLLFGIVSGLIGGGLAGGRSGGNAEG